MNSNNQTSQDYSSLPMYQTGDNFTPLNILNNNNYQNTSINNSGISNINTTTPAPQNNIFEFYFRYAYLLRYISIYGITPIRKCETLEC